MEKISFRNINISQLRNLAPIREIADKSKFDTWFGFQYTISEEEAAFLNELIEKYETYLKFYSEEELKAKFIIPILNKIDFYWGENKDWYERTISATINGYLLSGMIDYMVASGSTRN